MTNSLTRFAAVAALAVVTGTACALEAGVARADNEPTAGVTRTELQRLPAPDPAFEIVQTRTERSRWARGPAGIPTPVLRWAT